MHSSYVYILETNHVSSVYVLQLLSSYIIIIIIIIIII